MADKANKFSFFESFWDAACDLDDASRLAFYDAVCAYAFTGREPSFEGVMSTIWKLVKPNIDSSIKGQRAGSKGGRPTAKPPVSEGAKPPVSDDGNPPFGNGETHPETDMDMDMDREMEVEEFVPLERTNSSTDPAACGAAAAGAAHAPAGRGAGPKGGPAAGGSPPACPRCASPLWRNAQTGRWECDACHESFAGARRRAPSPGGRGRR